MIYTGFALSLIGAAGIAGAIEQGESLALPIIAIIAGAALWYIGEKGGGKNKSFNICTNSNVHNYPAGLETARRYRS